MKKMLWVFFILLPFTLSANTYIHFLVGGIEADSMIQGQIFAWEIDVTEPGNKVQIQIFEDVNNDQALDAGDKILEFFYMQDGSQEDEGGPGDSDGVVNGIILSEFGPFGFIPGDFIFKVVDEDDSFSTNHIHSESIADENVVQVIKGHVILNDVIGPDPLYSGISFGIFSENGMWGDVTDSTGQFMLKLPYSVDPAFFMKFLELTFPKEYISDFGGLIIEPGGVDTFTIEEGIIFEHANARVYGTVLDATTELSLGKFVGIKVWEAFVGNTERSWYADPDGNYEIYTKIGQTTSMYVNLDDNAIYPEYMMLAYWFMGSPYAFDLSPEEYDKNIDVDLYPADTNVVVNLEWDSGDVDSFRFSASSVEIFTISHEYTNLEGNAVIPVYSGISHYWTNLDEWETPVPEPWAIDPVEGQNTAIGDTAFFYFSYMPGINESGNLVTKYELLQNYPNPFNPSTTIEFNLQKSEIVTLTIYNLLGEKVITLIDGMKMTRGENVVNFQAADLASGIYFYTLETPSFKQTRKMSLIK